MINLLQAPLDGSDLRIAIVQARFNEAIGQQLRDACVKELIATGVSEDDILVVSVPGALEIPVVLQSLAESQSWDALVALGAVVRGETYHFEIVSNEMAAGITRVGLDNNIAIANGVLTVENDEQAFSRATQKGKDCAHAAVEMANLLLALLPDDDEGGGEEIEPTRLDNPSPRLN